MNDFHQKNETWHSKFDVAIAAGWIASATILCLLGILKIPDGATPIAFGLPSALIGCIDLGVGLWLLSGRMRGLCVAVATCLLSGYAIYNGYLISAGSKTCGCMGSSFDASPWWMLGVDLLMLASIALARIAATPGVRTAQSLIAPIAIATMIFATTQATPAQTDKLVVADPDHIVSVVDYRQGIDDLASVSIKNTARVPISLVGWVSSCPNLRVETEFPISIPAQSSAKLTFRFTKNKHDVTAVEALAFRGEFPTRAEAKSARIPSSVQFRSDISGRVEFEIVHYQMFEPSFVDSVFRLAENTVASPQFDEK